MNCLGPCPGLFLVIILSGLTFVCSEVPASSLSVEAKQGSDGIVPVAADLEAEQVIRFNFHYAFQLRDVPAGGHMLRVWIPAPRNSDVQQVCQTHLESPASPEHTFDSVHGNRYLYFELDLSSVPNLRWKTTWEVTRHEAGGSDTRETDRKDLKRYLGPNRRVPIDGRIGALAREAGVPGVSDAARAQRMYDFVLERMSYSKHALGGGRGDALWACDSRYGNCTDFHSLFIGMSRANHIPARFEMGFPLPYRGHQGAIAGYHCWAMFHDEGGGWRPVDISEADKNHNLANYFFGRLHARRVHFTTGRDLVLVPPQEGPPLNYFIYPHVEVDGKVHVEIEKNFHFDGLVVPRQGAK